MKRKLTKKEREDGACEAIIAGILRGWTVEDWKRIFDKMDEKRLSRRKPIVSPGIEPNYTYGHNPSP